MLDEKLLPHTSLACSVKHLAHSIQLVLGQLDGRIATAESRLLPIEYVPRESCGPLTEDAVQ